MSDHRDSKFEIFLSYSRKDNAVPDNAPAGTRGRVTALRDHILQDHRRFSTEPLRIFFDTCPEDGIKAMDDWRHRILGGLQSSKILLVCLSPNYFASPYCRWEWEEYCRRQVHRLMGSDSVATVYFVEVPGSNEQQNARRLDELLRGNFTDIRPWFPNRSRALQEDDVQRRMAALGDSLWERLQRARRAEAVPGNLRWQNPHFVGRREKPRKLHEQLGKGTIGVVSAVLGLGGQGKTELAVAYAHAWADCYPAGLWSLAAEGKTELLPLIGNLAWERALGFTPSEAEKNDPALLGRGVLAELRWRCLVRRMGTPARPDPDSHEPWSKDENTDGQECPSYNRAVLILLDNVSKPALLGPAQLATLPGGMGASWLRIVATTRLDLREQKDRLAILPVDALDEETALSLVRDHQPPRDAQGRIVADLSQGEPKFASPVEEAAAREIVRALGGFTLAVEQVALYLGLHPEVSPSAFLATLRERGLPLTDTLPDRDPEVAAQMLTQSKQLGLILDATLARLDAGARTALQFASLLPADRVPWPWLRALTVARHPELGKSDDLGAHPWLAIQRRLTGLRLLTSGDQPEIARIHRLVAAHLRSRVCDNVYEQAIDDYLFQRGAAVAQMPDAPEPWELDALLVVLTLKIGHESPLTDQHRMLALATLDVSERVKTYRTLPVAISLLTPTHAYLQRLAESDPANAAWQRDLSVSHYKLALFARQSGDDTGFKNELRECFFVLDRM